MQWLPEWRSKLQTARWTVSPSRFGGDTLGAQRLWQRTQRGALPTLAGLVVLLAVVATTAPFFQNLDKFAGRDWDSVTFFRYVALKTLRTYHQFPFWNPYACGGHDAWGYFDSDTIVVSPWLPLYLLVNLPLALRIEVLGTALIAAVGTWLLAGTFTRSYAGRCFVCVVWVVNGRWALQIAEGHTWHIYYAWLPWVLLFFERAAGLSGSRWQRRWWLDAALAGAFVALMVYTGALYPLPHTSVILLVYGVTAAVALRSLQPIAAGALVVAIGFGLSAPRLLAIADQMSRTPRLVDSNEALDLGGLLNVLTWRDQERPPGALIPYSWGWHEYGIYVGWAALILFAVGFATPGRRESSLRVISLVLLVLGLGAFHEWAPWTLLHKMPLFRSLHVPTRWLYPGVLTFALLTASRMGGWIERAGPKGKALDFVLLAAVAFIARDISAVSRAAMADHFTLGLPAPSRVTTDAFYQSVDVPSAMKYVNGDWVIPSLPAAIDNVGVIKCYAVGTLNPYPFAPPGHRPFIGALGVGDEGYRGEVFVESGPGQATIERWTPNAVRVHVAGAAPGSRLILNANFDRGWTANGAPTTDVGTRPGYILRGGSETVLFSYHPTTLGLGLLLFGGTVGILSVAYWVTTLSTPTSGNIMRHS